jgi:hypothetical protein
MSDYYAGRPGLNDWESVSSHSKGAARLHTGYGADFGEPLVLDGTGLTNTPIKKRTVKSYTGTAGATKAIGVSLNIKEAIDSLTDEDFALTGSHKRIRDITYLIIGACKVRNVGGTDATIGNTLIPADGGFEKMTGSTQESLGQCLDLIIPAGEAGYIWVHPNYEKADI